MDWNTCICHCAAGFKCGEYENPADFFLDVLTTCERAAVAEQEVVHTNAGIGGDYQVLCTTFTDDYCMHRRTSASGIIEFYISVTN